jgi:hypothetical protein
MKVDPDQIEKTMKLMIDNKLLRGPVDIKPLIAQQAL